MTAPPTATATDATATPTGGHLGGPAAPAIDLRTAADAHVTPIGSYKTSIPIELPPAPGVPNLSLNYDSAMGLGIAGVGWDLSVGWPTLISRDTRYGTPTWDYASPWIWGGAPLVPEDKTNCDRSGICTFRTSPDSLSIITMNQNSATAAATVTFPSGVRLNYEAIHYDGKRYPGAPAGAATDVFAFVLKSADDLNGYRSCFINHHWDDTQTGRVTVMEEIRYGRVGTDCDPNTHIPSSQFFRVVVNYTDSTAIGYYAPVSYRFGAPISLNNLLGEIDIYPFDWKEFTPYTSYVLNYESPADTPEMRQPRLKSVSQRSFSDGAIEERSLRQFKYGNRLSEFVSTPVLLDLGRDATELPLSLAGLESRPMRLSHIDASGSLTELGYDQNDRNAPVSWALTKQWSQTDVNGDGLVDTLVADEKGPDVNWETYETTDIPLLRPAEQWAYINEGIVGNKQISSRVVLTTTATLGSGSLHNPEEDGVAQDGVDYTRWIWQDGRGKTRTGMPQSVTSREIPDSGLCPPFEVGKDTRIWPFFPDGAPAVRARTIIDSLNQNLWTGGPLDAINIVFENNLKAFLPRSTVSAQLSGWSDLHGDGKLNWVVTPGMIERFDLPGDCGGKATGFGHQPQFAGTDWYSAPADVTSLSGPSNKSYVASPIDGPRGPMGLPLSFSTDSSQPEFFGATVPVGSLISSIPSLSQGPFSYGFWSALGSLTEQTIAPARRPVCQRG